MVCTQVAKNGGQVRLPTIIDHTFSAAFIARYPDYFDSWIALGQQAATRIVANGKEAKDIDLRIKNSLIIMEALDSPGLDSKQTEALEYSLKELVGTFGPTLSPIV